MDDRAPRIDPTSRRGRKLIDAAFRAIAKWRSTCEWGTVVVQPDCGVRIGRLGDASDRAPADQRTADGRRRESTVPPRTARSAPTRRADRSNQRVALLQAAQRCCRIRLLKLAFRGLRSTAALASTPTTANAASASSRRTATTTSEPMHDSAETLQAGASGVDAGSTCSITLVEEASIALSQRPAGMRISEERGITGLTAAPIGDDETRIPRRPRLHESFQLPGSYGHVREVPHAVITAAAVQGRGCCACLVGIEHGPCGDCAYCPRSSPRVARS